MLLHVLGLENVSAGKAGEKGKFLPITSYIPAPAACMPACLSFVVREIKRDKVDNFSFVIRIFESDAIDLFALSCYVQVAASG